MSSIQSKRTRSDRVATLKLPPGTFEKAWDTVRRGDVLTRVAMCVATAVCVWALTGGWAPPFSFRAGDVPTRNLVARVTFERVDQQATADDRNAAKRIADCVYVHDPRPLRELQEALKDKIFQIRAAASYDDVDKSLWSDFTQDESTAEVSLQADLDAITAIAAATVQQSSSPALQLPATPPATRLWLKRKEFNDFKAAFADDTDLSEFAAAISRSMTGLNDHGLLESLQHDLEQGNQSRIRIYTVGNPSDMRPFEVDQVRIGQAVTRLRANLTRELPSAEIANKIFAWLEPKLPTTLAYDPTLTRSLVDQEIEGRPPVMMTFKQDETVLTRANTSISPEILSLLQDEYTRYTAQLSPLRLLYFTASKFGMYLALYVLCGF